MDIDTKQIKEDFSNFIFVIDIKVGQNNINIIMPLHTLIIGHSICKWLEHYLLTKKDRILSADFNIKEMTTVSMAWNQWKNTEPANKTRHTHSLKQKN